MDLVKEESSQECKELLSSVRKELAEALGTVRSLVKHGQSSSQEQSSHSSFPQSTSRQVESESEEERESIPPSTIDSEEEEVEEESRSSRYKLSLEEVDELLKAIYTTLEIQEEKAQLSVHDKMYLGLEEIKHRVFPVHKVLTDTIKKEWKNPERGQFFSKTLKRRFPFEENEELLWNKKTKIDAAFSQVSRKTDLAFEDMGILKDAMDKRADGLLKKAWDSSLANLKPAMAATVVARNLECWLEQLKNHVVAGTSRKDLLESFPTLLKAVKYMADASAESIRMSARSSALVNSARRALWLKTWSGDSASKVKLCGIPFSGDLMFGPELETVLDRTADKKKAFPQKKKTVQQRKNFRPFRQTDKEKDHTQKRPWSSQRGRGRGGVLFRTPEQTPKKQ